MRLFNKRRRSNDAINLSDALNLSDVVQRCEQQPLGSLKKLRDHKNLIGGPQGRCTRDLFGLIYRVIQQGQAPPAEALPVSVDFRIAPDRCEDRMADRESGISERLSG